jgi:hypothetical protein
MLARREARGEAPPTVPLGVEAVVEPGASGPGETGNS